MGGVGGGGGGGGWVGRVDGLVLSDKQLPTCQYDSPSLFVQSPDS